MKHFKFSHLKVFIVLKHGNWQTKQKWNKQYILDFFTIVCYCFSHAYELTTKSKDLNGKKTARTYFVDPIGFLLWLYPVLIDFI